MRCNTTTSKYAENIAEPVNLKTQLEADGKEKRNSAGQSIRHHEKIKTPMPGAEASILPASNPRNLPVKSPVVCVFLTRTIC